MTVSEQSVGSPFRPKAWPLEMLRSLIRQVRLHAVKRKSRHFTHGHHIAFGKGADIRAPHFVEFGDYVSIGKNFVCEADLRMGSHVLVSSNVSFVGKDHPFDDPNLTVYSQPRVDDSLIEIGSDVLIGFGSIVVGSVRIGDGCIVGAGAVVTRDLPPNTVCAGVPARPLRERHPTGGGGRISPEACHYSAKGR